MRLSVQIEFDKVLDLDTDKQRVTVGRSRECDLVIPHDAISRKHCEIVRTKNQYFITDLGSANGVSINGKKILANDKVSLPSDALLVIGSLECKISSVTQAPSISKILSTSFAASGDYTATMRIARIDLEQGPAKIEFESKKISRAQRNPVSSPKQEKVRQKRIRMRSGMVSSSAVIVAALYVFFKYFK